MYIQHVATVAPEVGLRFADDAYSIQVPENATVGYLLKTLTIVNSRAHGGNIPLKCHIASGNTEGKFALNVTQDRNCALYLNASLDYEVQETYEMKVELMSLQGFINKEFSVTDITINVVDINDNSPYFIYPNYAQTDKFFAAIPKNAPLATNVIQIKADDKDSGKYGKLRYTIKSNESDYFTIDHDSGIIKTQKTFQDIEDANEPFKFKVKVRDNPNATADFNEIEAPVIVNLISDANRMILVIGDAKPDVVATKLDTLINVIQDQTGLVVGVEKLTAREYIGGNGTLEVDTSATDVWFYVIDPETETILPTNHSIVQRYVPVFHLHFTYVSF